MFQKPVIPKTPDSRLGLVHADFGFDLSRTISVLFQQ